jgi:hypothetical protein
LTKSDDECKVLYRNKVTEFNSYGTESFRLGS